MLISYNGGIMTGDIFMNYIEQSIAPESIISRYPRGVLFYHQPDLSAQHYPSKLINENLPEYMPVVGNMSYQEFLSLEGWLTDKVAGFNDKVFADKGPYAKILEIAADASGLSTNLIEKLLPELVRGKSVRASDSFTNGYMVPVANSPVLIHSMLTEHAHRNLFAEAGYDIVDIPELTHAVIDNKRAAQVGGPLTIYSGHIDTHLTAFSDGYTHNVFLDEQYEDYAELILERFGGRNVWLETVSTDIVNQGGLNIRYLPSGDKQIALIPSRRAVGSIGSRLEASGFSLLELGEDQADSEAGIKCRTLALPWRTQ